MCWLEFEGLCYCLRLLGCVICFGLIGLVKGGAWFSLFGVVLLIEVCLWVIIVLLISYFLFIWWFLCLVSSCFGFVWVFAWCCLLFACCFVID